MSKFVAKKTEGALTEGGATQHTKGKPPKGAKKFKEYIFWFPEELKGRFIGTNGDRIAAMVR